MWILCGFLGIFLGALNGGLCYLSGMFYLFKYNGNCVRQKHLLRNVYNYHKHALQTVNNAYSDVMHLSLLLHLQAI